MKINIISTFSIEVEKKIEATLEFPVDRFLEYVGKDNRVKSKEDILSDVKFFLQEESTDEMYKIFYGNEDPISDTSISVIDFETTLLPLFEYMIVGDVCCVNAPSESNYCNICGKKLK